MSEIDSDPTATIDSEVTLDMAALAELQDILEEDFFGLLDEFIDSSRQTSAQLGALVGQQDMTALRRGAHSLKGSALNIGAPKLGQAWSKLEDAAVAGLEQTQLERLLVEANAELEQTVAALQEQFLKT